MEVDTTQVGLRLRGHDARLFRGEALMFKGLLSGINYNIAANAVIRTRGGTLERMHGGTVWVIS